MTLASIKRLAVASNIVILLSCTHYEMAASKQSELDRRVEVVVTQIEHAKTAQEQQAAFATLEGLGKPAVPYIIKHMDSRKKLLVRAIVLENPPTSFEVYRHYRPELVVDAVVAILNQLTGMYFGNVYNGADDETRARTVAGWRTWCSKEYVDVPDGCVPD